MGDKAEALGALHPVLSRKVAGLRGGGRGGGQACGEPGGDAVILHPTARSHNCRCGRQTEGDLLEKTPTGC